MNQHHADCSRCFSISRNLFVASRPLYGFHCSVIASSYRYNSGISEDCAVAIDPFRAASFGFPCVQQPRRNDGGGLRFRGFWWWGLISLFIGNARSFCFSSFPRSFVCKPFGSVSGFLFAFCLPARLLGRPFFGACARAHFIVIPIAVAIAIAVAVGICVIGLLRLFLHGGWHGSWYSSWHGGRRRGLRRHEVGVGVEPAIGGVVDAIAYGLHEDCVHLSVLSVGDGVAVGRHIDDPCAGDPARGRMPLTEIL